jgi:hypothetical protein
MEIARMKTQIEEPKLVKIDLKNLCPNDPNFKKITEAGGWVLPEDGPQHQSGWITDQKTVEQKKRTFSNGREVEFVVQHQTAKRICQKCGGETILDPYE